MSNWHLPGGKALLVGGQFVTNADECCCEEVEPPDGICPNCTDFPESFLVSGQTGLCFACDGASFDCGADITLIQRPGPPACAYRSGFPAPCEGCFARLDCDSPSGLWFLTWFAQGTVFAEFCTYTKVADSDSSPAGNYTLLDGTCNACGQTATVFSL